MSGTKYICAHCRGTFRKNRSDAETLAEYETTMPNARARGDDTVLLCDPCFTAFMVWARRTGLDL